MADSNTIILFLVGILCLGLVFSQDTDANKADKMVLSTEGASQNDDSHQEMPQIKTNESIITPNQTTSSIEQNRTDIKSSSGLNLTVSSVGNQSDFANQTRPEITPPKWPCLGRNMSSEESNRVILVNESGLLQWVNSTGNTSDGCAVVLFFAQFCPFSAKLAPMYNAFGRSLNNTPVLAMNAYKFTSVNARFGVVSTPTILIFHAGKPVLKFNHSKTLDDLRTFVKNHTGLVGNSSIEIEPQDYEGPVSSEAVSEPDYYLLSSSLFLMVYGIFVFSKSSYGHKLWERLPSFDLRRTLAWFKKKQE